MGAGAPAVGLNPHGAFPVVEEVSLTPGDIVLMITDGVLESTSPAGEDFGAERVLQVLREQGGASATQIANAVADAASRFSAPTAQQDDITVVVLKVLV